MEVRVEGLPIGLGTHAQWDRKLDGRLAQAIMSIPAIKAVGIADSAEGRERLAHLKRPGISIAAAAPESSEPVLIGRYVGLIRANAPFLAGSTRMRLRRFQPNDVIGARNDPEYAHVTLPAMSRWLECQ